MVSISLVVLYLVSSIGMNILVHTCGGFTTIEMLPTAAKDPCGCGDDSSTDKCCTLELKSIHLEDAQKTSPSIVVQPEQTVLLHTTICNEIATDQFCSVTVPVNNSPPGSIPATILNCTFLI